MKTRRKTTQCNKNKILKKYFEMFSMVGPVPTKVQKTAVGKEQGAYFTVNPKNFPRLDAEFNGDYVTAINHGLIP